MICKSPGTDTEMICVCVRVRAELQLGQNMAADMLTASSPWTCIQPVLPSLHGVPIEYWIHFEVMVLTFKALYGLGSGYLQDPVAHPMCFIYQHLMVVPGPKDI